MADNGKVKIIVISALSILTIILFYFFISSDGGVKEINNSDQTVIPGSRDKIKYDIDSILYSFGIKPEWIREVTPKFKDSNSSKVPLLISKEVRIPADLLTIDLNYEITNYLRTRNFENKVTEDPKTKNIDMNIMILKDSVAEPAGNLKFLYLDSLKRSSADVCLVLDSLDEYSLSDVEKILSSTQDYSVFLPLRNDKADYQSKIIELKKDFLMKFSVGDEDDIEADFKVEMKENFWKSKIRSVTVNFPQTSGIILINKSRNREFYNTIKEEFFKNNLVVYSDSIFVSYGNTSSVVSALFENILTEAKKGEKFLFYDVNLTSGEFETYDKQVYILKKLGYRFFKFRELAKRMKTSDSS